MKRIKKPKTIDKNSLEMRNSTRHRIAPPTIFFKDKKHTTKKFACRKKLSDEN